MNNRVRKAPAEGYARLAVYDASGSRVDVSDDDDASSGDAIVWIEPSQSSQLSFTVSMDPETTASMADIQFVVETAPFEDAGAKKAHGSPSYNRPPSPTPMTPTVPNPAPSRVPESSFVSASGGGGILCNGRRGHARGKKGYLQYELVTKHRDHDTLAEVVAGYSEYHGPVTLTPRIVFKRKGADSDSASDTVSQGEL